MEYNLDSLFIPSIQNEQMQAFWPEVLMSGKQVCEDLTEPQASQVNRCEGLLQLKECNF